MAKAIEGAAMLGGAAALGGLMLFPGTAEVFNNPLFYKLMESLAVGGISMEAGAVAEALTSNRGQNITVRQPASFRQIVWGEQRVGGVMIYRSTTGAHHDQINYIIVLAAHVIDSIVNLYLDGRQVRWNSLSVGNGTRNGVNFGGSDDGNTYTGPNGQQYNFGGRLYCEARFGDQAVGDVIGGLTANDPAWAPGPSGSPYVGGCAYIYLKREYDENLFPSEPEIRVTIRGKNNILDPRTGTTGYSTNWALIVADVLTDPHYGLGLDPTLDINQAQLIAAANVCDESVALAFGGTEKRYCTHFHCDTSLDPGSILQTMMLGAAGRLSLINGQYYIWPAYWQGPSFAFDMNAVTSEELQWNPQRSFRDRFNRINGTYIAPNYPYNDAGNLYDTNGFYMGRIANNFPFGFLPTNYPQYACDTLHGYPADNYLIEDLNIELPKEVGFQTVLSIAQAQRCAKIMLLRNRFQGTGSWGMGLQAFGMQELDVVNFSCAALGWAAKVLEVQKVQFQISEGTADSPPAIRLQYSFAETDPSIYVWSTGEELSVYDVPSIPLQRPYVPAPPTGMSLTSGAGTAVVGLDGVIHPRIEVQWIAPYDVQTTYIQVQHFLTSNPSFPLGDFLVDVANTSAFITGVVAGLAYNVRIRGIRSTGGASAWVEIDAYTVVITLSTAAVTDVAPGALVGTAFPNGTATITVNPFSVRIGNAQVSVLPGGPVILSAGISQGTLFYVYYVDPNFSGGAVTPIATQLQSDFLGKPGYFLIGALDVPTYYTSLGTNYAPTLTHDIGTRSTSSPDLALRPSGNYTDGALVSAYSPSSGVAAFGDLVVEGFPPIVLTAVGTIWVEFYGVAISGAAGTNINVQITIGAGTPTVSNTYSASAPGVVNNRMFLPAGTDISTVKAEIVANAVASGSTPAQSSALVTSVYISTTANRARPL